MEEEDEEQEKDLPGQVISGEKIRSMQSLFDNARLQLAALVKSEWTQDRKSGLYAARIVASDKSEYLKEALKYIYKTYLLQSGDTASGQPEFEITDEKDANGNSVARISMPAGMLDFMRRKLGEPNELVQRQSSFRQMWEYSCNIAVFRRTPKDLKTSDNAGKPEIQIQTEERKNKIFTTKEAQELGKFIHDPENDKDGFIKLTSLPYDPYDPASNWIPGRTADGKRYVYTDLKFDNTKEKDNPSKYRDKAIEPVSEALGVLYVLQRLADQGHDLSVPQVNPLNDPTLLRVAVDPKILQSLAPDITITIAEPHKARTVLKCSPSSLNTP